MSDLPDFTSMTEREFIRWVANNDLSPLMQQTEPIKEPMSKGPNDTVELTVDELLDMLHSAAQYGYWRQAAEQGLIQPPAHDPTEHHKGVVDARLTALGITWAGL